MKDSYNIGLIRVVTFSDEDLINLHGKIIERYFPMLKVESRCIDDQPYGVHDEESEALAVPKIIELARSWGNIDALIISCAGDPAVDELRQMLNIPVIGAGESTALLAKRYGQVFGVHSLVDRMDEDCYKNIRLRGVFNPFEILSRKTK